MRRILVVLGLVLGSMGLLAGCGVSKPVAFGKISTVNGVAVQILAACRWQPSLDLNKDVVSIGLADLSTQRNAVINPDQFYLIDSNGNKYFVASPPSERDYYSGQMLQETMSSAVELYPNRVQSYNIVFSTPTSIAISSLHLVFSNGWWSSATMDLACVR